MQLWRRTPILTSLFSPNIEHGPLRSTSLHRIVAQKPASLPPMPVTSSDSIGGLQMHPGGVKWLQSASSTWRHASTSPSTPPSSIAPLPLPKVPGPSPPSVMHAESSALHVHCGAKHTASSLLEHGVRRHIGSVPMVPPVSEPLPMDQVPVSPGSHHMGEGGGGNNAIASNDEVKRRSLNAQLTQVSAGLSLPLLPPKNKTKLI